MTNLRWAQRDQAQPPDRRHRCDLEALTSTRCHFIAGELTDAIIAGLQSRSASRSAHYARMLTAAPSICRRQP